MEQIRLSKLSTSALCLYAQKAFCYVCAKNSRIGSNSTKQQKNTFFHQDMFKIQVNVVIFQQETLQLSIVTCYFQYICSECRFRSFRIRQSPKHFLFCCLSGVQILEMHHGQFLDFIHRVGQGIILKQSPAYSFVFRQIIKGQMFIVFL